MNPTPTCRHLHTSGTQCGSPALRGEPFCFYHHTTRKPMPQRTQPGSLLSDPQLPAPDDFLAIQRGIGEVLRLLVNDRLTDQRAQSLLRGLAIASGNLARHHRREEKLAALSLLTPQVTGFINDPQHGTIALDPSDETQPTTDNSQRTTQPVPDPIPLLTPDPSPDTSYDQGKMVELHTRFTEVFHQQREAFEARKEAELAAVYEDRYTQRERELEARYSPIPVQTSPQSNQDFTTQQENMPERSLHLFPQPTQRLLAS